MSAAAGPVALPQARALERRWDELADRFAGSDPGLNRFRNALMSVVTIGVTLEAEWAFVRATGALQLSAHGAKLTAAAAAKMATANHEFLVIGMLLGAIVGMISSFGVMDPTARGQLVTMSFLPLPMVAALTMGIELGSHRVLALASFAVVLAVGTYLRRFGPRGFVAGMLLFMGDFFGFFLHGAVGLGDLGWLTAELGVGLAVAIAVRFGLFYPNPGKALARSQRSYAARARKVAALTLSLFDADDSGDRQDRRVARQLVRLNEAALMIDAQLAGPGALAEGSSAHLFHQRLFDLELALTNIVRFAPRLATWDLPAAQRLEVRLALSDLAGRDVDGARGHAQALLEQLRVAGRVAGEDDRVPVVVLHRFAGSVISFADAITGWLALGRPVDGHDPGPETAFAPSVVLLGGWLPGSAAVSAAASMEAGRGHHWADRLRLAPYTRTAIQMGVAVGGAIALGDILSGQRFYWAVIAAFITFMGANNSGEQVRKAIFRVLGTLVGIAVGSGLVSLVGHHTYWSITVILVALFLGFYLMRVNYAFMVVGITVMVSQLYVQLGEFSHALLWLRLEETAIGAGVAIAVVLFVLPLRTGRVLHIALRQHLQALGALVGHASDHLLGVAHAPTTLRSDARDVDASYQALVATAQPVRRNLMGNVDEKTAQALRLAAASRHYGRNLVIDIAAAGWLDPKSQADVSDATTILRHGIGTLTAALSGDGHDAYVRSSSVFDRAERRLEEQSSTVNSDQLAIRDLKLIDGALAGLAGLLGVGVTDLDSVGAGPTGA